MKAILGCLLPGADLLLEVGILGWSYSEQTQSSHPASQNSWNRSRRFNSSNESTISTSWWHYMPPSVNWNKHLLGSWCFFPTWKSWKCGNVFKLEVPRSEVFVDQPDTSVSSTHSAGRREFLIDGLLANLGVGIVSLLCSWHLTTGLPVLGCIESPIVALGFQEWNIPQEGVDTQSIGAGGLAKRFPMCQASSMHQVAGFGRGSADHEDLERLLVDWIQWHFW